MTYSVNFVLGEKFSSYQQLKEKITAYQQENNFFQLAYTDSRTLDAARKRAPKKANEKLHYYSLHLTCNLGGKPFHSKGSGQRPCHRYSN